MTTIDGHILIPNMVNYSERPRWSRRWLSNSSQALKGNEVRKSFHSEARITLEYRISVRDSLMAEADSTIRAARTLGRACCPMFGRGGPLSEATTEGADSVTVFNCWSWRAGDYVFLGNDVLHEVAKVTTATLVSEVWELELETPLDNIWGEQTMCWPLLFGEFVLKDTPAISPTLARFNMRISEMKPMRAPILGEATDEGPGIGAMEIGTDFVVA